MKCSNLVWILVKINQTLYVNYAKDLKNLGCLLPSNLET